MTSRRLSIVGEGIIAETSEPDMGRWFPCGVFDLVEQFLFLYSLFFRLPAPFVLLHIVYKVEQSLCSKDQGQPFLRRWEGWIDYMGGLRPRGKKKGKKEGKRKDKRKQGLWLESTGQDRTTVTRTHTLTLPVPPPFSPTILPVPTSSLQSPPLLPLNTTGIVTTTPSSSIRCTCISHKFSSYIRLNV